MQVVAKRPGRVGDDRIDNPFSLTWIGHAGLARLIKRTQTLRAQLGSITRTKTGFDIDFDIYAGEVRELGQSGYENFSHESVGLGQSKVWDLEFTAIPSALNSKPTKYALIYDGTDFQIMQPSS
jgi:hypothetical protein